MPFYEISHCCPLSISQKDELAAAITEIHAQKFTTARLFVNVSFTDVSNADTYIGGKRNISNHIRAYVRVGPSRTQEDWNDLCASISAAWYEVAGTPLPRLKGRPEPNTSLRSVIILGGMTAGLEAGFVLPAAGGDVQWLQQNMEAFKKKADGGDEEFKDLVAEVNERGLLGDGKSAQQRLEEALGWGDAA